jgi:hypothetical protein
MENDLENNDWKKEVPYMASLNKANPFEVPAGYFDNLGDRIRGSVAADAWKSSIGHGGFAVPEEYFENLSDRIVAKTKERQQGKLVRLLQNNFFKYSAAACLVLMSGILLYLNEPAAISQKMGYMDAAATEQMLFDIDEEVIIDHIQHSEQEKAASKISDAELESYILNNFSQSDLTSE